MEKRDSDRPGTPLTPREQQVADEIMKGRTNREIAKALGIGYETAKEHVQRILRKCGVNRRELVIIQLMQETLTAESLGKDFAKQFDQLAAALEKKADELKCQLAGMRALVGAALRKAAKKR